MNTTEIEQLVAQLLSGELSQTRFVQRLTADPRRADLGQVNLDLDRRRRCGYPEVVFGEGKSVEILQKVIQRLLEDGEAVLATRVSAEKAAALTGLFDVVRYNAVARTLRVAPRGQQPAPKQGQVAVVTAGTSDLAVAEEARETLDWMAVDVTMVHDVGVAGPHRLPAYLDQLNTADAIVVVAGLEGALPSVVGGYVACPVIAVPTSIGYGASFGGVAALLGMLNSCAANVSVVNIDAGFKGGYVAGLIAQRGPGRSDA